MSNIAKLLKETIERTARKQARSETNGLRKASGQHRKVIAELSLRIRDLERQVAQLHKMLPQAVHHTDQGEADNLRFSAKGLHSLRKRLGLSAKECGVLVGVSGWTIGSWERGEGRPNKEQVAAVAVIRKMGKREAQKRARELTQK